jgi:hypothetical protein
MGPRFFFFCYKTKSINNLWKQLCAQHDQFFLSLFIAFFARSSKLKEEEEAATTIRQRQREGCHKQHCVLCILLNSQ